MGLVSSAVLQAYTGSSDTALLAQLAGGFEAWLQGWIPRYLGTSTTLTEVRDGPRRSRRRIESGLSSARLRTMWLAEEIASGSLLSVKYRSTPDSSWVDLSVDANGAADLTDFEIRASFPWQTTGRQLVRLAETFPAGDGNLQIKYTHGYAEDVGPADVMLAVMQGVKGWIDAKAAGLLKSERVDDMAWTFAQVAAMPGVDGSLLAGLKGHAGRAL
ncbi:MAG: hypothetical protein GY719_25885 [bacterium]|nr:hypothetical protein [bacterium]